MLRSLEHYRSYIRGHIAVASRAATATHWKFCGVPIIMGGAIARVPTDATAFSYRHAALCLTVAAIWASPDEEPAPHVAWARALWTALQPASSGGGYVDQLDADEGSDRIRAAYAPHTWARLVTLKRRYDPDNVFRSTRTSPRPGTPSTAPRQQPTPSSGIPSDRVDRHQ